MAIYCQDVHSLFEKENSYTKMLGGMGSSLSGLLHESDIYIWHLEVELKKYISTNCILALLITNLKV